MSECVKGQRAHRQRIDRTLSLLLSHASCRAIDLCSRLLNFTSYNPISTNIVHILLVLHHYLAVIHVVEKGGKANTNNVCISPGKPLRSRCLYQSQFSFLFKTDDTIFAYYFSNFNYLSDNIKQKCGYSYYFDFSAIYRK